MYFDFKFIIEILLFLGSIIALYIHMRDKVSILEERYRTLTKNIEDHNRDVKELKVTIQQNTEAIIELKTVLNVLLNNIKDK